MFPLGSFVLGRPFGISCLESCVCALSFGICRFGPFVFSHNIYVLGILSSCPWVMLLQCWTWSISGPLSPRRKILFHCCWLCHRNLKTILMKHTKTLCFFNVVSGNVGNTQWFSSHVNEKVWKRNVVFNLISENNLKSKKIT